MNKLDKNQVASLFANRGFGLLLPQNDLIWEKLVEGGVGYYDALEEASDNFWEEIPIFEMHINFMTPDAMRKQHYKTKEEREVLSNVKAIKTSADANTDLKDSGDSFAEFISKTLGMEEPDAMWKERYKTKEEREVLSNVKAIKTSADANTDLKDSGDSFAEFTSANLVMEEPDAMWKERYKTKEERGVLSNVKAIKELNDFEKLFIVEPVIESGLLFGSDLGTNDLIVSEGKSSGKIGSTFTEKEYAKPTDRDVLIGRGRRCKYHPGNIAFRNQAGVMCNHYRSSFDYHYVSQQMVHWVHEQGGRFLKQDISRKWYEVANIDARIKASHALGEHKTKEEREATKQQGKAKEERKVTKQQGKAPSSSLEKKFAFAFKY